MRASSLVLWGLIVLPTGIVSFGDEPRPRLMSEPAPIRSDWDDLLEGVKTPAEWQQRKAVLRERYLALIRDDQKPVKPPLALETHESVSVDGKLLACARIESDVAGA